MAGITFAAQEAQRVAQQNAGKWFKITLKRSLIGMPWQRRLNARALGLSRVGQQAYKKIDGVVIGNIVKIKELVKVEIKKGLPLPNNRSHPSGFEVIGSMLNKSIPL